MCVATQASELSVVYDWSNTELIEYAWLQAQNCDINFQCVSIFGSNSSLLIKVKTVPLYRVKSNNLLLNCLLLNLEISGDGTIKMD